jgi:hypothetical protein
LGLRIKALPEDGLSSGLTFLVEGAKSYFKSTFQSVPFHTNEVVDKSLNWVPSLHFKINEHLTIICEASESPYPLMFSMRRQDVLKLQMPISVYCVCPEEAYLAQQAEAKRLMNHGYGLLTVDAEGNVQRRSACIPLLQQITDEEFHADIRALPRKVRTRLAESFETYKHNAPSGSADIAEVMEGLILKAGREAANKKWISNSAAKPGAPAATLAAMHEAPQLQNALAAISAAHAYISMYRNVSHHFPKDKKQAAKKYRDCRHSYLEGLKKIAFVRESFVKVGLSGGL